MRGCAALLNTEAVCVSLTVEVIRVVELRGVTEQVNLVMGQVDGGAFTGVVSCEKCKKDIDMRE